MIDSTSLLPRLLHSVRDPFNKDTNMASFLSFASAWATGNQHKKTLSTDDPLPPCVTTSHSGDSVECSTPKKVLSLAVRQVSSTPDGLKPRMDPYLLHRHLKDQGHPLLSPPPSVHSESIYSETPIAESPKLESGYAKTAVGALLAAQWEQMSPPVSAHTSFAASPSSLERPYLNLSGEGLMRDTSHHVYDMAMLDDVSAMSPEPRIELDDSLNRRKRENQRRHHEELIVACFERLQDTATEDAPALVQGLPSDERMRVVRHLSVLLHELNLTQPEEYFMSPTHVSEYAHPHGWLRDALLFVLQLVQLSVPDSERSTSAGRWQLVSEVTPRRVGGDTSVFSLPDDATPMTSNVSVSSTLPTVQDARVATSLPKVLALLGNLSDALEPLRRMNDAWVTKDALAVTDGLKQCYRRLLEAPDWTWLLDAFELVNVKPMILPPWPPQAATMIRTPLKTNNNNYCDDLRRTVGSYEEREECGSMRE